MSEESNTDKISPVDFIFATTVGLGLVCLVAKYRGGAIQRLKRSLSSLTDPLSHMNAVIINTPVECQDIVQKLKLKCDEFHALGFDCEWVSVNGSRHKVALLQLAASDGLCALIRICKLKHIPLDLQALLEDDSILKVGVAPSDDAKYLLQDHGVLVRGCLDLRHLVVRNGGVPKGGLAGLSESVLGVKLDKNWHVRCSNWEADVLSERQVKYAALDAMVGTEIFKVLVQGRTRRGHLFQHRYRWKTSDVNSKIKDVCRPFVDMRFSVKTMGVSGATPMKTSAQPTVKQQQSSKPQTRAYAARSTIMYHNCYMHAPDGELLCTCDTKKARWYVSRGLATLICDDPYTIRLNFEPAGRVVDEAGLFYTQVKANCCVVCGNTESYLRKNIVPHEYRKHFPKVMKDHTSHDVLLMCVPCHLKSNHHDSVLRNRLAAECNAPIGTLNDVKMYDIQDAKAARMAAKALLHCNEKIPEERRKELEKRILDFRKECSELTPDILQEMMSVEWCVVNANYHPHGLKVVQHFSTQTAGGLVELEKLWREHFLETMQPKFLPNRWSVTHNHDRLSKRAEENRVLARDLNVAGLSDYTHLLKSADTMAVADKRPEEKRDQNVAGLSDHASLLKSANTMPVADERPEGKQDQNVAGLSDHTNLLKSADTMAVVDERPEGKQDQNVARLSDHTNLLKSADTMAVADKRPEEKRDQNVAGLSDHASLLKSANTMPVADERPEGKQDQNVAGLSDHTNLLKSADTMAVVDERPEGKQDQNVARLSDHTNLLKSADTMAVTDTNIGEVFTDSSSLLCYD